MPITVTFCSGIKPTEISLEDCIYVENVITSIAKSLSIKPLCQHLFGLKVVETSLWLSPSKKIAELDILSCQFRIRFFLPSSKKLCLIDPKAHEYFYYQIREDFLASTQTFQKNDALGLVVTDVLHHLLTHDKKVADVELKSFMPKWLNTIGLRLNVQRKTEDLYTGNFKRYASLGSQYFREQYLEKIEDSEFPLPPEKYSLNLVEGRNISSVSIWIDPYNAEFPGLFYSLSTKNKATHACRIEEVVLISIRKKDQTVELCHETGPPFNFKFASILHLESFVSCINGYHRLMKIWSFDLCSELETPSLSYLKSNKCHGPVGSEFVAEKLKQKKMAGIGVLRESTYEYDAFVLTVLKEPTQPSTDYSILFADNKFHFNGSDSREDTLLDLINRAIKLNNIGLEQLLPSSNFDRPEQLLLCSVFQKHQDKTNGPRILHVDDFTRPEKTMIGKFSNVYLVKWRSSDKDVAIKIPMLESHEINDFMCMLNQFVFVGSDCVVKVFGILVSPFALVMEHMSSGALDNHLQANAKIMTEVDLVEASTNLAKALWDLSLKSITHQNIRCHNILVVEHTTNSFKVKLSDPGKVQYTKEDIHWIPRRHHLHPSSALSDSFVDIWAFATTLWEIFSLGVLPLSGANLDEVRLLYSEGNILPRPNLCTRELYKIMSDCWHPELYCRQHPQTILRDVNQIFYDIFNSRRDNPYATIANVESEEDSDDDGGSNGEQASCNTQVTTLTYADGTSSQVSMGMISDCPPVETETTIGEAESSFPNTQSSGKEETLRSFLNPAPWVKPAVQNQTFEFGSSTIALGEPIGHGNYGFVLKGIMKYYSGREENVALKRLKSVGDSNEFMKEVGTMQSLFHENIVKLHGLIQDENNEYMVMEYLPLGSLDRYIRRNKNNFDLTSDKKLLSFAHDIAMGMDYLEDKEIIHRDLAARNILAASENHVKITDFGLARKPNEGNYYVFRRIRELPIQWYALESIQNNKYSYKTDVWSYGITCWEIFTRGREPDWPKDPTALINYLKGGNRPTLHPPCHHKIYSRLIKPCWEEDSSSRPNFSNITRTINELQAELRSENNFPSEE